MQSSDPSYTAPPFPAFPCTSRYIPLGTVDEAFTRVCRSIDARETISLIIGPPGTGKSLICRLLAERYSHDFDVVVLGETPINSSTELFSHLLHQLRLDPVGQDPRLTLIDYLHGDQSAVGGLLILVDEAQSFSADGIEAIRMATNIMHEGEPRVFSVLCGGMKLDEILVDSSMEAFTQRIATRCYLHPMNAEETRQYICDTIQSCGSEPSETISEEAIAAVHHACNGVPRLVNQMLTQAIDCAAENDELLISEAVIDQAWAQLQQLPSPIVDEPKIVAGAPIEFGELGELESVPESSPSGSVTDSSVKVFNDQVSQQTSECCGVCEMGCRDDEVVAIDTIDEVELTVPQERDLVLDGEYDQVEFEPSQPVAPTPSAESLFGEFDDEEELSIGNSYIDGPATPQEIEATAQEIASSPEQIRFSPEPVNEIEIAPVESSSIQITEQEIAATPSNDLEEMLHQEIIGLSQMTDLVLCESTGDAIVHDTTEPETSLPAIGPVEASGQVECGLDEQVEDLIPVAQQTDRPDDGTESETPAIWIEETEPASAETPTDIHLSEDDSDILVIEDELELRRVDPAARRDSHNKTISVDFQAMLARMRSGAQ